MANALKSTPPIIVVLVAINAMLVQHVYKMTLKKTANLCAKPYVQPVKADVMANALVF